MITLLDGKEYAVGLNWFAITSTDEAQQFQKEMELSFGILKLNKNPNLPSTVALAGSEYEGQVSLAGILSYAYSNLLYVAKTESKSESGEEMYYLCAVKNGAVPVEGDMLANLETVRSIYAANLAEMSSEIAIDDITRLGTNVDPDLFDGVTLLDFHDVLDVAQRYNNQCTIRTLTKAGLSKTAMVAIVVLFVLGGYLGYSWLFATPPPPPPPPVTAEVAPPPPPPAPLIPRRDPYEVFLEEFVYHLNETPQPQVVTPLISTIKNMSPTYKGWTLKSILFAGAEPQSLTLSFAREPYSNVNGLLTFREMGYFTAIDVAQDGNQATAVYPLVIEKVPYIAMNDIRNLRPETEDQYFDMVTALQKYDLAFQGDQAATQEGYQGQDQDQDNDYFVENSFTMSGTGLWSLERVAAILSTFKTLGIVSVSVVIEDGNYNWSIQGVIYG